MTTNHKLLQPFHKIPFIALSTWNTQPEKLKTADTHSTVKYNLKSFYLDQLRNW